MRKTDVTFYQPAPEESHVYGKRGSSPDQPTPEESHVYGICGPSPDQPTPEESHITEIEQKRIADRCEKPMSHFISR
ncbi:MAG: hypothetical protein VB072_00035, partial [Lentimicrobium sp.]|uniref:hypothetical protein n=1 Tax=Lentimicrobium sp. TaxID=2034841 RepID=UPI002B20AD2C